MLSKPATVTAGDEIKATHLNSLVDYYNEIWSQPASGPFLFNASHHTGTDDRRFGWGQTLASINPTPVGGNSANNYIGTLATISDINQTIAQVNAGLYHTEDDPTTGAGVTGLYPLGGPSSLSAGSLIPVTLYNDICDKAETLVADKYKVDWANYNLFELQSINTANWADDLAVVHKFEFNNYDEARYFFNSGGELTLELSMAGGGNQYNQIWASIFDQFDSIRIGAETCKVVSDAYYDVVSTSGINKGFYTGITYSTDVNPDHHYVTILDAGVFAYPTTGQTNLATVYLYSEYNSRRIRLQLRGEQTVGATPRFNIYVRVILIEDADDTHNITQAITLTSGYVQPSTTPLVTDGNKTFMTEGATLYQFTERNAPTITEETPWTEDEYGVGVSLAGWGGTFLTNVRAGYFILDKWGDGTNVAQQYTIRSINDDVTAGSLITGHAYKIKTVGTTDFTTIGAANNTVGTIFTATETGTGTGTAGGSTSTDTDFTLIGAPNNTVGTVFTTTGIGTGSGSADEVQDGTDDPGINWTWAGGARYTNP